MSLSARAVVVRQLPETVDLKRGHLFLRELESSMNVERPCIVFDCSLLIQMDMPAVQLLLHCLEEAMKRNGDIKLAAIPAGMRTTLDLTGVNRLFEIFDTNIDAVNSFLRLPLHAASQVSGSPGNLHRTAENAA
jgi:anti-anti-sigma factor